MKIVIAPDSFKESLAAGEVALALSEGIRRTLPKADCCLMPLADGGEGTLDALITAGRGTQHQTSVVGPLGQQVSARYGVLTVPRTIVLEIAQACGLDQVAVENRDAEKASSFGCGELLREALQHQPEKIIVGLGGSASVDGGAGMMQALGVSFYDHDDHLITTPLCGGSLLQVARLDYTQLDPRLTGVKLEVACDVDNPLLGPHGAAPVFGPQKGADEAAVKRLALGLQQFYGVVERALERTVIERPGAGAAGGLGAALMAFLNADLRPGIELVLDACLMREVLTDADLLITGEGRLDRQTLHGKTPLGVARLAREMKVPVIAVGGALADDATVLLADRFDAIEAAVCGPCSTAEALNNAQHNLVDAGIRIGQWIKLAEHLKCA